MAGGKLLIADDDEECLFPLQVLLGANGCSVDQAHSASQVLSLTSKQRYDALILDIRFRDLSGYTIVRQLRMKPAYSRVLIIGLTGWDSPDDEQLAREAGFDHFFLKPVDFDRLAEILDKKVCRI